MYVLVLAAEADETRQTITFLVACLVGIAALLTLLTAWYWFDTSPKRRSAQDEHCAEDPEPTLLEPSQPEPTASTSPSPEPTTPDEPDAPARSTPAAPDREVHAPAPVESSPSRPAAAVSTWDFVAAARQAENGLRASRPTAPSTPRIAVQARTGAGEDPVDDRDELARARMKRERRGGAGLSDEAWASVMRSAFEKLDS